MSDLPLRVLGDRVLVKPDVISNAPEQTASGVIVAKSMAAAVTGEDASASLNRGTVIAVGHPKHPRQSDADELTHRIDVMDRCDCGVACDYYDEAAAMIRDLVRREPCCAIGDDVLFAYDAGQSITLDDETYILLHESDLFAVVEPEKE